jgi:predicted PolB exonuclease-like 3'-5' exonuclease
MNLVLDLETIPTDRADVRDYIAASVTPPGNISKAETIAKWNEESRPAAIEEAVAKTGLDGSFGRVCVIGWAIDDGEPMTVANADDEGYVLREFAMRLVVPLSERHTTTVIGHNVSSFDLRFLTQRFIVNGIKPPMVIARAARAKPWEDQIVFDTMVQWAGVGGRVSLDKLCLALSIPSPKGELDGSKVWQFVQDGRIAEVADYCKRDVEAARAIWRRMTFATAPVVEQFEDVAA